MISPLASVDSTAKIGKNVTIQPFAYIEGDVEIGDDCVIMSNASILKYTMVLYWVVNHKIFITQAKQVG